MASSACNWSSPTSSTSTLRPSRPTDMHPLPALAVLLSYALSAAATGSPAGKAERPCKVQFRGDAFLAAASQRGLEPERKTACDRVSISDNAFYAMPLSACDIVFKNATWLIKSASFQNL